MRDEVLVLNATYEPLHTMSLRRAVSLLLDEKADLLVAAGVVRSVNLELEAPSVISLRAYVSVPDARLARPTRRRVLARDGGRCGYCLGRAETVDHVHPTSRGGSRTDWRNVVASCRSCNETKGDRLLAELGWELRIRPRVPRPGVSLIVSGHPVRPAWEPFLRSRSRVA